MVSPADNSQKRVSLVLGAGGARGYAHLGVMAEARARGLEIAAIAGTSMGALVGGLAAADRDQEFADWVRTLTPRGVLRLLDPALVSGPGAVRGNRVIERITDILGDVAIEDLKIPFTAVAADLTDRREVWFQRGPLVPAIRASIAIPGALTPVQMEGRLLVDGGILNPVPMEPVLSVDADLTIAVDLGGQERAARTSPISEEAEVEGDTTSWLSRIGFAAKEAPAEAAEGATNSRQRPPIGDLSALSVMLRSFETMQETISRYRMAANPPDILISVPISSARVLDFHRAAELIDVGRALAAQAFDDAGI